MTYQAIKLFVVNLGQFESITSFRGVAQPGSARDWGSRGRRFKSGHPDHLLVLP